MKYSLDKYKYYQFKNENGGTTVTAASTYAGRTVKGYAKCDPRDNFDVEEGKKLAAARCNMKIANKRVARASQKYLEAARAVSEANAHFEAMKQYYMDAVDQADEAAEELRDIIIQYK
jgi:cytochrome c556